MLDIKHGKFCSAAPDAHDILVVGTSCLFGISESGAVKMQKKLDFDPASFTLYDNPTAAHSPSPAQNLIISSFDQSLYIFRQQRMIWSAKVRSEERGSVTENERVEWRAERSKIPAVEPLTNGL